MKVLIAGAGKVGFALGQCLKLADHDVEFHEINNERCAELIEKGYIAFNLNHFDHTQKIINYNAIFVCVPTPTDEKGQNLDFIHDVITTISRFKNIANEKYLFMKSTVLPGTMRNEIYSRAKKAGYVCISNPEFLTESDPIGTILNAPFQIFGFSKRESNKHSDILERLFPYPTFKGAKIEFIWEEAELFKYASNFLLASRLSAWNQIFLIAKKLKVNSMSIATFLTQKKEIGEYGKYHGKAYGLSCLPKDVEALNKFAGKNKIITPMLSATVIMNDYMKREYGTNDKKYVWN